MAKNIYLQIEFKSGNLFEYSKEPQEGFEPHTSTKDKVSYRRYHKEGVYGIYRGTSIRDTNFGKDVSLHMVNENSDNVYISMGLFDQQKNISAYAESFIAVLPAMEMNFVYRVFPYAMDREGTEYRQYGVSVKHADMVEKTVREDYPLAKLTYTYTKKDTGEVVAGNIPAVIWEDNFDGTKKKNANDKNKFLYETLMALASGSQKISNKVTGGEAPKAVTEIPTRPLEGVVTPPVTSPQAAPVTPAATPETITAYEQTPPPTAAAPAPVAPVAPAPVAPVTAPTPTAAPAPIAPAPTVAAAPAPVAQTTAPATKTKLPF